MIEKNGYIVVESGDTLGAIAKSQRKSVREMMALNPSIRSADKIRVGQKLKTATKLPKANPAPTPTEVEKAAGITGNETPDNTPVKPSAPEASAPEPQEAKPTKREEVAKATGDTPVEPTSNTEKAECCCILKQLSVTQLNRGADAEGKGGATFTLDIVKMQENKNIAKPNGKNGSGYELYITAPSFKDDATPDTKTLQIAHAFKAAPCKRYMTLKSTRMEKVVSGEVKINSYGLIEGAVDRKPPKASRNTNPRAHKANYSYKNEWNLTKLLKLVANPKEELYETYDVLPQGSTKCTKQATLYVAKPMKLSGEAKFAYTGEYDVKTTGILSEFEAKAKTQCDTKLTLSFLADTYEFSSSYTSGMQIPKGEKGALHTVPAKELFGNFTKWFDPIYAIVKLANESPRSLADAKANLKSTIKKEFGSVGSVKNHHKSNSIGTTSIFFKADNFQFSEKPNTHTLVPTGSIELGITVFDGSEIRLDLIPAITKSIDALKEVVSTATNNTLSGEVQADLVLTGSVSGSCKLEAKADKLEADKSAVIGATVGAKIEAKIEAQAKWLFFYVKAGATAALASAKSIDDAAGIKGEMTFAPPKKEGEDLDFNGDVKCTGMAVYLGVYASGDWKNKSKAGNDTAGGGVADWEQSEQPAQDTSKSESAFKVERSCHFVILNEFSFKEVLLKNKAPKPLTQYPSYGSVVTIEDDMLKDARGNIVGAMDNRSTMPDMSKPHL